MCLLLSHYIPVILCFTQMAQQTSGHKTFSKEEAELALSQVSDSFLTELSQIQNTSKCEATSSFYCGHKSACGLGCQIHHRVGCLMFSYAMGIPLIHDSKRNWPFRLKWEDVFLPLGSRCKPTAKSIRPKWTTKRHKKRNKPFRKHPLRNGLPIKEKYAKVVENYHPHPFLWWTAQFMKYAIAFSESQIKFIQRDRQILRSQILPEHHVVGVHIRRTDKNIEIRDAYHPVDRYMREVSNYFLKNHPNEQTKHVIIASDEMKVIQEIKARYYLPEWKILQVREYNRTLAPHLRKDLLRETISDFVLLSEADYVVCGFTSNIARFVYEFKAIHDLNATETVKSIDYAYYYSISGVEFPWKVIAIK